MAKASWWSTLNGMFLVAGTCVGGGMLALPVASGVIGFLPSLIIMILVWAFMTMTGLLYLESTLWFSGDANIATLSEKILGPKIKYVCWGLYLFLAYASLVAYLSSGGRILNHYLSDFISMDSSSPIGYFVYLTFFTTVIFLGVRVLGIVNTTMMTLKIAALSFVISQGLVHIDPGFIARSNWDYDEILKLIPLLLTSFSFPIVPMLVSYLNRDIKAIRFSIVAGTGLTFFVYAIWLFVVLGIVPLHGEQGLLHAYGQDLGATFSLQYHLGGETISHFASVFGFFALSTSYVGIAFGLYHFLADGLKLKKTPRNQALLAAIISLPTLFFMFKFEKVFYNGLEFSGGIGDSILSGMLPVSLIWVGRKMMRDSEYRVPFGKGVLFCLFLLSFLIFTNEIRMIALRFMTP